MPCAPPKEEEVRVGYLKYLSFFNTSTKNFCSKEFFAKIIITYPDKKKQVFFIFLPYLKHVL